MLISKNIRKILHYLKKPHKTKDILENFIFANEPLLKDLSTERLIESCLIWESVESGYETGFEGYRISENGKSILEDHFHQACWFWIPIVLDSALSIAAILISILALLKPQ